MSLIRDRFFQLSCVVLCLVGCGQNLDSPTDPATEEGVRQSTAEQLHEGKWGPDNGYARVEYPLCRRPIQQACPEREAHGRRLRARALRGDLEAQRQLAGLFEGGGGLIHRPAQACAWRIVVAANPHNLNRQSDEEMANMICQSTPAGRERRGAQWLANRIHLQITGTGLPEQFW